VGKKGGKNKGQSRRSRRKAEKLRLERRDMHRWLIQNGLAVVMILISAKTCQYAEIEHALTERISRIEAQMMRPGPPTNLRITPIYR
jgi:hypothetical protein